MIVQMGSGATIPRASCVIDNEHMIRDVIHLHTCRNFAAGIAQAA